MAEGLGEISEAARSKQKEFLKFLDTGEKSAQKRSQDTRGKMSQSHGGKSVRIREEIERGITDPRKIAENLGLTMAQIADSRKKVLKNWGIDVPSARRSYAEIENAINRENNDEKLQEILNGLSTESITSFMRNNKDQNTFIFLGNLLKELGFSSKNAHLVGGRLRTINVSVGKYSRSINKGTEQEKTITNWVILNKRRQEVVNEINAMSAEGKFKKLPTQVA